MDTDPALHQHLSSYRNLQPNLQTHKHQPQHVQHPHQIPHQQHPQHQSIHHQQHQQHQQHSPHPGQHGEHAEHQYAPHNGLDLSSLVNDDYHHDLQRLQAVNHAGYHPHQQSPFDGHRHMHESHTPDEAHQGHHHIEQNHAEHQHHSQANVQGALAQGMQQNVQQQQHTHPSLRPYPLMHQGSGHTQQMGVPQEDVFGQTPHMLSHTPEAHAHAHLAPRRTNPPAPNTPAIHPPPEDEKLELNREKKFKIVPNPPDLEKWRQRLFDVNEMITLSEDDYYTYFPHVDNVYSHRSTQKYKRKPFVSHYWDCRLKGRPPGTPKSEDPNKKKRKRTARERDLCDLKIKITEYFEGAMLRPGFVQDGEEDGNGQQQTPQRLSSQMPDGQQEQHQENADPGDANNYYAQSTPQPPHTNLHPSFQTPQPPPPQPNIPRQSCSQVNPHPGASGARYFTIQRVNGNGGNGKGDGVAGPHKHTLAESDKIKKNSVIRAMAKEAKEIKRATGVSARGGSLAAQGTAVPVRKATGEAATTIRQHAKAVPKDGNGVTLFGSCVNIQTQRVWIALEVLRIPYQYIETDEVNIPEKLKEVCQRPEAAKLPAMRKGNWGIWGSNTILEYLNEVAKKQTAQSSVPNGGPATAKSGAASSRRVSSRTASLPNPEVPAPASAEEVATPENDVKWAGAMSTISSIAASYPSPCPSFSTQRTLLPSDPQDSAYARQWADFVDKTVLPAYENYLQNSTLSDLPAERHSSSVPIRVFKDLQEGVIGLVAAAHPTGPFFGGTDISMVDIVFAPVAIRMGYLLVGGEGYGGRAGRGWFAPKEGTRWESWCRALEGDERVRATCCDADGYEEAWQEEQRKKLVERGQVDEEMGRRRSDESAI